MDPYIRDFEIDTVCTERVSTIEEAGQVLNVNMNCKNIKILHNNIRSISKNFDEFKCYLHRLSPRPDCIIFTETFMIDDLSIYALDGYNILYNEGNYNKNDGTVIFIRIGLQYSHRVIQLGQLRLLGVRFAYDGLNYEIVAAYRSPSTCPHLFTSLLDGFLREDRSDNDYTFLVGRHEY